ncbi:cation diffusion facilitator family transporter [Thiomicrorhabdus sediminis]|uniref:Cation transporter n=1 Tax=Thiomicrorhabdus sediminis TaxID=2580412 RepID=A0A4P9K572_9GAMM|nr:cation diffusion facilitator family transporter [Thiomicrorhabdus sediminis]QCU89590.1 cation transporter [Thiomicrorhabdus sediminis]
MSHHQQTHHHHSHHEHQLTGSRLALTILINLFIAISQIIGGIISGSLALLSDALHNLSDVAVLALAYVANRLAKRPATSKRTFGFKRAELMAALFNGALLVAIAVMIFIEGIDKLINPEPIASDWVIGLAALSIVLNWISVRLLFKDSEHNSNIKAAYLHLATDIMTSFAVLVGGLAMLWWQVYWLDALISMLISIYLIKASWSLLKSTIEKLMLFSPTHLSSESIAAQIEQFDNIENMHHLHLWQLDDSSIYLQAHIDFSEDLPLSEVTRQLETLEKHLKTHCGISHCTLQAEYARDDNKDLIHNH